MAGKAPQARDCQIARAVELRAASYREENNICRDLEAERKREGDEQGPGRVGR
jgi:hypothetical protein